MALWLGMGVFTFLAIKRSGIPLSQFPEAMRDVFQGLGPTGALIYITVYALRPLVFFPASILTLASGLIFGPIGGVLYTIVGENLSACLAFFLARFFGRGWSNLSGIPLMRGIDRHLRENGFMTVLILRLVYLPFDAVNFTCGITGMRYGEYAAATFLGILPGIVTFVYFGSGWFDRKYLIISGAVFVLSIVIARFAREKSRSRRILDNSDAAQ